MRTDPVIAYRIWKVSPEGRLSTAYRNSGKWPWMKPYSAACNPVSPYNIFSVLASVYEEPTSFGDHDAPHFDCTCGLYGYKSVKCLEQTFEQFYKGNCVLGRVALWGRVTEHTDGYRAEYGYPQVLYTDLDWPDEAMFDAQGIRGQRQGYRNENIRKTASKYGIDTAPFPEEVLNAYSQFVQKKRYEEEKARQLREAQEKILKRFPIFPDDWSKKLDKYQKSIDDFYKTVQPGFLSRYLKGNI